MKLMSEGSVMAHQHRVLNLCRPMEEFALLCILMLIIPSCYSINTLESTPIAMNGSLTACSGDQISITCNHDQVDTTSTIWGISRPVVCSTIITHNQNPVVPACGLNFVDVNSAAGASELRSTAVANANVTMSGGVIECRGGNQVQSVHVENISLCVIDQLSPPTNLHCINTPNGLIITWNAVTYTSCAESPVKYNVTVVQLEDGMVIASLTHDLDDNGTEVVNMTRPSVDYSIAITATTTVASCDSESVTTMCKKSASDNVAAVTCPVPETFENVNISSNSSILEGSNATFWCTESDGLVSTEPFTSVCYRNASWIPNPVSRCRAFESDDMMDVIAAIIAGSSFGAITVIILILLAVVGTVAYVKGSVWNHTKNLMVNVELSEEHEYNIIHRDQQNEDHIGNIIYADIGQLARPKPLKGAAFTVICNDDRVEYAKLNHMAQNSMLFSSVAKSTNEDISLNLDSLLIQLQDKVTPKWYEFGVALGIEKEVLDRYLNYSPEQGIVKILDHWLRSNVERRERSWGEIARALRQISYHQLAEEIESINKTGVKQLPSDHLNHKKI